MGGEIRGAFEGAFEGMVKFEGRLLRRGLPCWTVAIPVGCGFVSWVSCGGGGGGGLRPFL